MRQALPAGAPVDQRPARPPDTGDTAPGKSDSGDAIMRADILRTDGHRFRALAPTSDAIRALQAMARGRE
jgi:hypothetical protein